MVAYSVSHHDVTNAFIAQALACKQAVLFARDMDFSSVIIEGDSLTVIKKLNASNSDKSTISPIIHDIKVLVRVSTTSPSVLFDEMLIMLLVSVGFSRTLFVRLKKLFNIQLLRWR
ncbi:hypothetical protein V6N13_110035 [Hibiscus sabdariffa]